MKSAKTMVVMFTLMMLAVSGIMPIQASDGMAKVGLMMWIGNEAFIEEMTRLGYVEGQNISYFALNYADLKPEDFQNGFKTQLQMMVDSQIDVLVTNTDSDAVYYRETLGTIPMVFARSDDPVATGAVADLIKPGGFTTGIITNKPHERRLQILTEIKPNTKKVYYLYSTLTADAEPVLKQVQSVAQSLNVEIIPGALTDPQSIGTVLDNMPEDIDWIFLTPYVYLDEPSLQKLMDLSNARQAGLCYFVDSVPPGYVMGYGPSLDDTARQAARIVDRILRGGNPAELPVEIAENYLTINLEAAQVINLAVPEATLRQANLIIRPGYFDPTPTPGN
ncbi:MAG: ABC transporter substrate-binding protein [Anaerolinea sp.]|nr:ABC transporter substrate-binding protein [Anaerolinea sp.]CAG1008708.1 hypothetical protein ANRL4_03926 [Anaerolineae bacterium]